MAGGIQRNFEYTLDDHVALVTMRGGDNLINPDFIQECLYNLDVVEKETGTRVLIFHSAHPKTFSLGIDVEWALKVLEEGDKDHLRRFSAPECLEAGFATKIYPGGILLDEAMAYSRGLDKKRSTIAEMKRRMHRDIVQVIREQDPHYISKGETIFA
jgi:enoyl-CoA hydratase/carnithine racemase